jgi:hypothetical protein
MAAAQGHGPRGPVLTPPGAGGPAQRAIERRPRPGPEAGSLIPEGALYTFEWVHLAGTGLASGADGDTFDSPVHDDPLLLIPRAWRPDAFRKLGLSPPSNVAAEGQLNPDNRRIFDALMTRYAGDWARVVDQHVSVRRLVARTRRDGPGRADVAERPSVASVRRSRPIRVFVSCAHADEDPYRLRFEDTLKVLQRSRPQLEWWHERKLIAGTPWRTARSGSATQGILDQLNTADIACLLISPAYMASDNCYSEELPIALRRYEEQGGYPIPIIIRETPEWRRSALGSILALPKDGRPLEDWPSADKFWASVAEGLAATIELVSRLHARQWAEADGPARAIR